jgi:uncharacterized membrane protein YcaP (DUF421 family)
MDAVVRGIFVYFFLFFLFVIAGKRAIAQIDTFDFVLLLIISEASQNALVGQNYSITYAILLILTLVGCEILMAWVKTKFVRFEVVFQGGPLILAENGKILEKRAAKARVDENDILCAARQSQGLERLDQIKFAILETNGQISIIPR